MVAQTIGGVFFAKKTFAYPAYQANSDLVVTGPYDTAVSGAGNWGNYPMREFITIGQKYRIRQNGSINRIRIYTVTTSSITGFYIKIWRKNGSNYDLVGTSNNIASGLVTGNYTTIDLSTPIVGVQEGDYYGYRLEESVNAYNFYARTSISGVTSYYTDTTPSSTGYAWESTPNNPPASGVVVGAVLPIELYMTAPQAAFIGDSIIAGHPAHYSFLETTATTNINSTIEKQFGNLTGYTYQNMGIGSQTTANISSRFSADIINLKPKIIVIEGGVNDIAGSVAKSTFIANWTSMLDAAQASSYITTIIVLKFCRGLAVLILRCKLEMIGMLRLPLWLLDTLKLLLLTQVLMLGNSALVAMQEIFGIYKRHIIKTVFILTVLVTDKLHRP